MSCSRTYTFSLRRFYSALSLLLFASCALPSLDENPLETLSFIRFLSPGGANLSSITFANQNMVFTQAIEITEQIPQIAGRPTSCVSTPALPEGLNLDNTTCKISGNPKTKQTVQEYEINASNHASSTKTRINITINTAAPTNFSYTSSPFTFTKNVTLSKISPNVEGTITSCASSPSLPTGLVLENDCSISGTPTVTQSAANYTITATNIYGSIAITISITISIAAPSELSYSGSPFTYTINSTITSVSPSVTGTVTSYSVSPSLPTGLALSTTTGLLSGTPTMISATTTYTITASNAIGSTTTTIDITVNDVAPSALSYSGSPYTFTQNATITNLTPTVTGTTTSYSISSALPTGLSFNTTTGVISGTPTVTSALATYTITATNSGGSTITTIDVTIGSNVPTNVTGGSGGITQALISWSNVSGATSYNIYFSTSSPVTIGGGGVTKLTSVTSPYTHTGLTDGVTYYYIVTSQNGLGESNASTEVSAVPGLPPQCTTYTSINGDDRTVSSTGSSLCDNVVMSNSWMRFTGTSVNLLSGSVPPTSVCNTDSPGYMTTSPPSTIRISTAATVCFHWAGNVCNWSSSINVVNCNGYYVYQLPVPTLCSLRYCTMP